MKTNRLLIVVVFLFTNSLFSDQTLNIPVGEEVADLISVSLILKSISISNDIIECHFQVKNSVQFNRYFSIEGAYVDEYSFVKLERIKTSFRYNISGNGIKEFSVEIKRPAKILYLKGIQSKYQVKNIKIKLSKKAKEYGFQSDISSIVSKIPYKEVPTKLKRVDNLDTITPSISVVSPKLLNDLVRTEDFSMIVTGKATDKEGIVFVTINDKNATLKQDGRFQKRLKLKIGKNPVAIKATDINDNVAEYEFIIIREEIIEEDEFSDVDFAPNIGKKNKNGIAVVFGIEEYQYAPSVSYAYNDADIFREYLIHTFGYSRENIYFKTNERATKGEFDKVFSEGGWIASHLTDKSDVIIYYAGHGAPDLETKDTYLIPYDVDPNYANTGYSLKELYDNLGKLNVKAVTVILDACFSAVSRDNEALLADARPVSVRLKTAPVPKHTVVFSAASENEISSAYKQKLHGLFTYFLLKGLNGESDLNDDKSITATEMQEYLLDNVQRQAQKMGREQHPKFIGIDQSRLLLEY